MASQALYALTNGDRIVVASTNGVKVRPSAGGAPAYAAGQPQNATGIIISNSQVAPIAGSGSATTYTWWNVNFDTGQDGWAASDGGAIVVVPTDTTNPIVTGFGVSSGSINQGQSVTITYSATDSGGLNRVELYRAPGGTSPPNTGWVKIGTKSASGGMTSGSFTDTPPPGVYWYGVTVFDNAGRQGTVTAQKVTVTAADTTKPTFGAFGVSPTNLPQGNSVTISYTVSDSGGSGLSSSQLWRAPDSGGSPGTWAQVGSNYALSGNGPTSRSFSDTPSSGAYWYGVHANDNAGNSSDQQTNGGFSPIKVTVSLASPGTPSSPSPANGAILSTQPTKLDWADTTRASNYDVYLKIGGGSFSKVGANLTVSEWTLSQSYLPNTFSWYVVAKNGAGSTTGPTWTFTLGGAPTVTLTAPNGGEAWVVGSTHNITATVVGAITGWQLDYSTNGGTNWNFITGQSTFNTTVNYAWTVPNAPSTTCRVRLTVTYSGGSVFDSSNSHFSISGVLTGMAWRDYGGASHGKPVEIKLFDSAATIDPTKRTWIIIHGRTDTVYSQWAHDLEEAIHKVEPDDQVLRLDWKSAASAQTDVDFTGEDWIEPVAEVASTLLQNCGFKGDRLNLIGHSWGANVAAEIGERILLRGCEKSHLALRATSLRSM